MFKLGEKSEANLVGVHPDLIKVAHRGIELSKYDFSVIEGKRTLERQRLLKAKGFSKTLNSMHLLQADGYSHAFDAIAVGDLNGDGLKDHRDKSLTWDPKIYKEIAIAMKQAAAELGIKIRWGGDFKGFFDGPHFELA